MTYKEVSTMIDSVGIPYAYYQFPEGTETAPPFICFYYPGDSDLKADNVNYAAIRTLVIELYTAEKDFTLEETVESVLKQNELPFSREEVYIDTEKLFMITYNMEVILNGEQN